MVNLELYRVFYAVAKCGSLTKAAQELFISQPAVSQAIKQLENQLGVSLFNRTHNGMELSAAGGKLIYRQIGEALALIDDAENSLKSLSTTATGTVRIGATDSIFSHVLADKLALFNRKYPAVRLELISSTSPDTLSQLKDGKCDVAFINLPLEDREVRLYGTVKHLTDVFVAGDSYQRLKGKAIPLSALHELPLIMIERNTVFRHALSKYAAANWDLMLKLAKKGMGIGCLPREYCLEELADGELFELNVDPPLPARGVGIALAKNVQPSFAVKEFIAMFDII